MTIHVCIIGIDGSGKSTVATALPYLLAAEMKVLAGSSGDDFRVVDADQDHLVPGFRPLGLPLAGHLSKRFKQLAKRLVDNRRLYPIVKACHMIFQDTTAYNLCRRYEPEVMVSDGNVLLSAMGRIANYISPASSGGRVPEVDASDLKAVFEYLLDGKPLPDESRAKLPNLGKARLLQKLTHRFGLHAGWLPDVVIFLDISPSVAMERIAGRGKKVDRHENIEDLTQARKMYSRTLDAFSLYHSPAVVHRIVVDNTTPGETLRAAFALLSPRLRASQFEKKARKPLGTTRVNLEGTALWKRLFNYRYFFGYLVPCCFRGAWREPTFLFSRLGKLLLSEGYSANVMRAIYDQDIKQYGFQERIFLGYSLHRAVYDRLHILTKNIEAELEMRLAGGQSPRNFTSPAGYSYDLFQPLRSLSARNPAAAKRIHIIAGDLDPGGNLAAELAAQAKIMGLHFIFQQGDITDTGMRAKFEQFGPYDVVLFVGLSSWLPKPQILGHMEWIRRNISHDGVLVTDCFTPEFYAVSGWHFGWKANYYTPELYSAIAEYCGFDGLGATLESVPNNINHVMLFRPRRVQP